MKFLSEGNCKGRIHVICKNEGPACPKNVYIYRIGKNEYKLNVEYYYGGWHCLFPADFKKELASDEHWFKFMDAPRQLKTVKKEEFYIS